MELVIFFHKVFPTLQKYDFRNKSIVVHALRLVSLKVEELPVINDTFLDDQANLVEEHIRENCCHLANVEKVDSNGLNRLLLHNGVVK